MRDKAYYLGIMKRLLALVFFVFCMFLIVMGQKHIGIPGTLAMLGGLAGILLLLFLYNKQYQ